MTVLDANCYCMVMSDKCSVIPKGFSNQNASLPVLLHIPKPCLTSFPTNCLIGDACRDSILPSIASKLYLRVSLRSILYLINKKKHKNFVGRCWWMVCHRCDTRRYAHIRMSDVVWETVQLDTTRTVPMKPRPVVYYFICHWAWEALDELMKLSSQVVGLL